MGDGVVRYRALAPSQLAPYQDALRLLERDISYPLDAAGERFTIDHGQDYGAFYAHLGPARTLLATRDDQVLGLIAAAWKPVRLPDGTTCTAVYSGDFKVRREARGSGVAAGIFSRGLWALLSQPSLWGFDFAYGAAMRNDTGDVRRSFSRRHPGRLVRELSRQRIYFADPAALAKLPDGAPPVAGPGLELSARGMPLLVSTAGRKDLRVVSTGAALPLLHLGPGPAEWGDLGATLRAAGRAAQTQGPADARVCLGIDERLAPQLAWLEAAGIPPGGHATIIFIAGPRTRRRLLAAPWAHLSTSEI